MLRASNYDALSGEEFEGDAVTYHCLMQYGSRDQREGICTPVVNRRRCTLKFAWKILPAQAPGGNPLQVLMPLVSYRKRNTCVGNEKQPTGKKKKT